MDTIERPVQSDFGEFMKQGIGNVLAGLARFVGVDLTKMRKDAEGQPDYVSMANAISKAFSQIEINDANKYAQIQNKIDQLIGMGNNSPIIRKLINTAKSSLDAQLQKVREHQAYTELRKSQAQNLANRIDNATFGDLNTQQYKQDKENLQSIIDNPTGENKSVETPVKENL